MEMDFLGVHKPIDFKGSAGVGYVIIPEDLNRDEYIENCYRTQTVTIQGGYGYSEFGQVRVSQAAMQEIEFPSDTEGGNKFGSAVVWIKDSNTQSPIVIATIRRQEDYYFLGENTRRIAVGTPDGSAVEILATGDGTLSISVVGGSAFAAKIAIKVNSPNADSEVTVDCDNEVSVNAGKKVQITTPGTVEARFVDDQMEEKTVIRYEPTKGLKYKDEFENEITAEDGKVNVTSKEISHNDGSQPMVLGDKLSSFIGDFIDAVMKLTVITPVGTSTVPVNVADFAALKTRFDEFKSTKSKLE